MIAESIYNALPSSVNPVIGDLPSQASNVTAIIEFDGNGNTEFFGSSTLFEPLVKVVVRHTSYATADLWMSTVVGALHKQTIAGTMGCWMIGSPMYLGKGDLGLNEFQATFKIIKKE